MPKTTIVSTEPKILFTLKQDTSCEFLPEWDAKEYKPSILEVIHDVTAAGEGQNGEQGEGQLQAHQHIQKVVHTSQLINASEDSQEDGWQDGNGTGQQHTLPALPFEVQKALEKKKLRWESTEPHW